MEQIGLNYHMTMGQDKTFDLGGDLLGLLTGGLPTGQNILDLGHGLGFLTGQSRKSTKIKFY